MDKELIEQLHYLSKLKSLLDLDSLYRILLYNGVINISKMYCMLFSFLILCISIVIIIKKHGLKKSVLKEIISKNITGIIVVIVFGVMYNQIVKVLFEFYDTNMKAVHGMMEIGEVQFRMFLYGIQKSPQDFANVPVKTGNIINFLLSIISNTVLTMYYIVLIFGPFLFIVSIFFGPICMSLATIFKEIRYNWLRILIASFLSNFTVAIGFNLIGNYGILQATSNFAFVNTQLISLALMFIVLLYLVFIHIVNEYICGISFFWTIVEFLLMIITLGSWTIKKMLFFLFPKMRMR
jgi:hypothetical protein